MPRSMRDLLKSKPNYNTSKRFNNSTRNISTRSFSSHREAGDYTERTDDDIELSSHLDEMLMTMDDEHTDFDPNEHWVSCWGRFCYEINPCQNWFLVDDPPFCKRTLDIPASFAPTGPWPIIGKFTSFFSAIIVLVWSLITESNMLFFLAYLSTWNLVFAIIYLYCSLMNTLFGVPQPFSRVGGTVRACWFFFAVTTHLGLMEALLYWGFEINMSDAKYDFRTLMLHGGVTIEVLLDGFTVNFIPLRWMQWWGCCLPIMIAYIGFTLIHGFFLWVGNPNEPDRNSIYKIIDWRFDWKMTLMRMLIATFVISPLIFAALWMMSLYKWCCCFCWRRERRRYLENTDNLDKYRDMQKEMEEKKKAKKNKKKGVDGEKGETTESNEDPESTAFFGPEGTVYFGEAQDSSESTSHDSDGFAAGRHKHHSF